MSTASKVLMWLIIVAVLPLFVLTLLVLGTHTNWRTPITKGETELEQLRQTAYETAEGPEGIHKYRADLLPIMTGRGHVWKVRRQQIAPINQANPAAGVVVTVAFPQAAAQQVQDGAQQVQAGAQQMQKEMTVFAFEDARNAEGALTSGRYLGEFRVADLSPDGRLAALQPLHFGLGLPIAQANENWALYENMPTDSYDIFAGLEDQQLAAMLPAATVAEYRKHGKRAEPSDPPERVIDGNYVRMLRDYDSHFREVDRKRAVVMNATASAQNDIAQLTAAQAEVEKNIASFAAEKQDLLKERELMFAERDQVQQYRDSLAARLANGRKEIARLLELNRQLAERLAAGERAAALRIEQAAGTRQASRN